MTDGGRLNGSGGSKEHVGQEFETRQLAPNDSSLRWLTAQRAMVCPILDPRDGFPVWFSHTSEP